MLSKLLGILNKIYIEFCGINFADVSLVTLSQYWARLEDPIYMFGWERSPVESQIKKLVWTLTNLTCRSWGTSLAQPGAWDNLDIFTDGVLFIKDMISNASLCYVSI